MVTCLGIVLSQIEACSCSSISNVLRDQLKAHSLYGIYFFQPGILKQTEASNAKDCVEDVDHISRSIS